MCRAVAPTLTLAVLLAAHQAAAATLSFSRQVQLGGGAAQPPPLTVRWELENINDAMAAPYTFAITGLTPANSGQSWTVDASNAASYGLDWPAAVAASETTDWRFVDVILGGFDSTGYFIHGDELLPPGQTLTSFSLARVIIDLVNYQHNGQSSSLNDLVVRVTTEGEGTTIPEPGGLAIMTGASLAILGVRRRPRSC